MEFYFQNQDEFQLCLYFRLLFLINMVKKNKKRRLLICIVVVRCARSSTLQKLTLMVSDLKIMLAVICIEYSEKS